MLVSHQGIHTGQSVTRGHAEREWCIYGCQWWWQAKCQSRWRDWCLSVCTFIIVPSDVTTESIVTVNSLTNAFKLALLICSCILCSSLAIDTVTTWGGQSSDLCCPVSSRCFQWWRAAFLPFIALLFLPSYLNSTVPPTSTATYFRFLLSSLLPSTHGLLHIAALLFWSPSSS